MTQLLTSLTILGYTGGSYVPEDALHFLYTCTHPVEASAALRLCWPIVDRDQRREFKREVYVWLEKIKLLGFIAKETPLRKSFLDDFSSKRVESIVIEITQSQLQKSLLGSENALQYSKSMYQINAPQTHSLDGTLINLIEVNDRYSTIWIDIDHTMKRLDNSLQYAFVSHIQSIDLRKD